MTAKEFQQIAPTIPNQPGIYKYFDSKNELIYVGKAKDLRKRTSSYFSKTIHSYKTHELVKRIKRLEFTITGSEQDAFLLENSLIKQYKPRYNIELKDDKTYPFIVIKNEPFPRIFLTRHRINDGSEYLGPFTSVAKVRELLSFIKSNVPLRTCNLNLTENNIKKGKFKVCLEYHLGNCKGPCEGLQNEAGYKENILQVKNLLKGNLGPVIQHLKAEMKNFAETLEFENAEKIKKKLEHLENYSAKSVIVSSQFTNLDVFSILKDGDTAYVNYLMVQNGIIVQTHTIKVETKLEETEEEILPTVIVQMRETFNSTSPEIVVPFEIPFQINNASCINPKAGDKKKLLDLSLKNVNYFAEELKRKKILKLEGKTDTEKQQILINLQKDLFLTELPVHIECFDNSNFQGSFPVSAMVCFKDGVPSKKDYRHFNIKTVEGINDFASMKEVVFRRYSRLLKENEPLPQLIIIDGGKGQLNSAMESIKELDLAGKLTVVGLAKNEEEIFYPGDMQSLKLPWNSESLKLIRRIRDEVHRFGISFHRLKRSKGTFTNELENIQGIGKTTANILLKHFRSVNKIETAPKEELEKLIGPSKAALVINHFSQKGKDNK